ncbi:PrpR N-terminal domain-containing protein [Oribacterium sp. P6A1]|uniref:PrpR N-terminal domain-containing protein n=1 Tax=Oribacterium sp. P6A1 TaxID=1410612 RepID=UPI00055BAB4C|nr:PrpR N-terminal domain-containing protein [Oribacterium sp. P6A1]
MNNKIRVLGIAPYAGMKTLMLKVAEDFKGELDIEVLDGDLQEGVLAARNNFHGDFDVIVSRGGTARMLRTQVPVPVVEIELTDYDILRALRLADNISSDIAVVGFSNITEPIQSISKLIKKKLQVFTIDSAGQLDQTMSHVHEQGYEIVLCDAASAATAKRHGLNCVLLTSGQNGIRKAFTNAIDLVDSMRVLKSENAFLRQIIDRQANDTVIFDENDNIIFSNMTFDKREELQNILKKEIPNVPANKSSRIIKYLNRNLYHIKALKLDSDGHLYTVFYIERSRAPFLSGQSGLKYYTQSEAHEAFYNSFFVNISDILGNAEDLERASKFKRPVMIFGEEGTGKESAANMIYNKSSNGNHPFIVITCELLNDKSIDFLQSNHHSPFADSGNTIYISGLSHIKYDPLELLSVIMDMEVCSRNHVILSFPVEGGAVSKVAETFTNKLGCTVLTLSSLNSIRNQIPKLINLYLSQSMQFSDAEILGMETEGIGMMQEFSWPHNYAQFRRIMEELVSITDQPLIRAQDVEKVLAREKLTPTTAPGINGPEVFDMNRTLDEMNAEIVLRVLKECDGNQTLASKRLGISRTTVWRYAKT